MFFIPSLLASSNEIDDVPIPDAPPISMIRGSSDLLIFFQALYFLANNGSSFSNVAFTRFINSSDGTIVILSFSNDFSISEANSYALSALISQRTSDFESIPFENGSLYFFPPISPSINNLYYLYKNN